jgi:hypothetical protein
MGSSRRSVRRSILCLLPLLFACGRPPDTSTTHRVVRSVKEGVEVIRNLGGPKYEGELFEYEKILEIREDEEVPDSLMEEIVLRRGSAGGMSAGWCPG